MDIFKSAEALMGMTDTAWARHANPWSVYTRFAASVPTFLALWSAHWIGWWSLAPIIAAFGWIYINPRFFKPPSTAESWAARGVLGERAFLNRKQVPIPREHLRFAWTTTGLSGLFMAIGVWGYIQGEFWAAFAGWHASVLAKAWFVDRMAWLWDAMKDRHPAYAAWAGADWTVPFGAKTGR